MAVVNDVLTGLSFGLAKTFASNMLRLISSEKGEALVRRDEEKLFEHGPKDVLELLPGAVASDILAELLQLFVKMQNW